MLYYAVKQGKVLGVGNFPDEVVEFVDRFDNQGATTWTPTGMQVTVPEGRPTGWRIMKPVVEEPADA
jgi:hypothetical protein